MWSTRPDATLVRDLSPVRRFMPFLSPRRNESVVYYAQEVEVEAALAFLARKNETRPKDAPLTLFHLVLRALAQVLHERPRINRFTAGGRLWQRDGVWLTFSAKKRLDEAAPIVTVKKRFDADETLDQMGDRLLEHLRVSRSDAKSTSDKEVGLLLRLPPFVIRGFLALARAADRVGLLPRRMIESDPMFCSIFVANLGSVGLEAGYHHLWEYGTCPIFCVVGRIEPGTGDRAGRRIVRLKYTFDERIEDGFYAARGLDFVRERLENPETL